MSVTTSSDTVIVGGGLMGLVTAWRASRRGWRVTVVEGDRPHAASGVAAGMLTPATEANFGEESLMRFGLLSRDRYPAFIAELEAESGLDTGYRRDGTLQVAATSDDLGRLTELSLLQERLGIKTQRLTSRECRRLEPMLAPSVRGGLLAPEDHSVDPRRLMAALREAATRRGATFVPGRVTGITVTGGTARGVRLESGESLDAERTVLAAGTWSGEIDGVPEEVTARLRPVKGQLLRLAQPAQEEPVVTRTVRGLVKGTPVYLVPREPQEHDTREVVLGATQEELGYDTRLTVGGLWEILRDARELVPGVSELEITETCVGLRPATQDSEPLLGPTRLPGLHAAVGHFRHGVLLTPVTGDAVVEALDSGRLPDYASRFGTPAAR